MIHIIHLDNRPDRLNQLLPDLERHNVKYQLWPGIVHTKPSIGIAMAHQQIVRWAAKECLPEITIGEDDLQFTAPGAFEYYLQNKPPDFDLYISGITYGQIISDNNLYDFSGLHLYTINQKFYNTFLSQDGATDIDRSLKGKGKFILCNPMVAIQRNGFSDNKRQEVDYSIYFNARSLYRDSSTSRPCRVQ